jgi:predicted DsbA family dithiol-disulfide isomerase
MTISIDIVSDVICPWCFLGKQRLDRALAASAEDDIEIRWRPFLLDGSIPREGMPRKDYLERKFGKERLADIHAPLMTAAAAEGVPYDFDAITVTPNTLDAHRLIRWSHDAGRQHEMAERLFRLYWSEGGDIGKRDVLIKAAADVGLDTTFVHQALETEADLDAVIKEISEAAELGISGVPTFIFGNRYAVVGAQPSEVLASAISRVRLEQRAATR